MSVVGPFLETTAAATERRFQNAVRQACELPAGRLAVVLHLSRLRPPVLKPYHRSIALSLLQDVAACHGGQVFALGNGDLVLLSSVTNSGQQRLATPVPEPSDLPEMLGKLMPVETTLAMTDLVSVWRLEQAASALRNYATTLPRDAPSADRGGAYLAGQVTAVDAVIAALESATITNLVHSQTAISIEPGLGVGISGLRPLFREVAFSVAGLEAMAGGGHSACADPFLFGHLAARLDQRMLGVVQREIGRGGALDVLQRGVTGVTAPVLHLNLTLDGVLSAAFASFVSAMARKSATLAVEIDLVEAVADPGAFALARARLAQSGCNLVLDGVSHGAMLLCRPWLLQPNLLKLNWSPRLAELGEAEQRAMSAAIADTGPSRLVLHRAETEAALRWGVARGIRRFQGRYVDAMLGAARIVHCASAARCTLRQCVERASAADRAGRAGCSNPCLLNAGAPPVTPDVVLRRAVPPASRLQPEEMAL